MVKKDSSESFKKETQIEILRSMWFMLIGSFIIMSNYIMGKIFGDMIFSAFAFVLMVYVFIGFFIYILYNPFKRFHIKKIEGSKNGK
jgi:cytochrome c biogenesis factor